MIIFAFVPQVFALLAALMQVPTCAANVFYTALKMAFVWVFTDSMKNIVFFALFFCHKYAGVVFKNLRVVNRFLVV